MGNLIVSYLLGWLDTLDCNKRFPRNLAIYLFILFQIVVGEGCTPKGSEPAAVSGTNTAETSIVNVIAPQGKSELSVTIKAGTSLQVDLKNIENTSSIFKMASVVFPAGAIEFDTSITISEGIDLVAQSSLSGLGLTSAQTAGPVIIINGDNQALKDAFSVVLPKSILGTKLSSETYAVMMLYRDGDEHFMEVVTEPSITISENHVVVKVRRFGVFEPIRISGTPNLVRVASSLSIDSQKNSAVPSIPTSSSTDPASVWSACGLTAHGSLASRLRYQSVSVPYGQKCAWETQFAPCENGLLGAYSGSYVHESCSVALAANCGDVVHGGTISRTKYQAESVAYGLNCASETQTATCHDGTLTRFNGSYSFDKCNIAAPANCGDVAHGSTVSRTRYQSSSVAFNHSCASEVQTALCTNGTIGSFSGTYESTACNILTQPYITEVTSPTENGTYGNGQTIDINVSFSEAVYINGCYLLLRMDVGTTAFANYKSGSGTPNLVFELRILSNYSSTALDYVDANSLVLQRCSLKNQANIEFDTTLPRPGMAGSLSYGKTLVIFTNASHTWQSLSSDGAPPGNRRGHAAVWTGKEMIIWGGFVGNYAGGTDLNDGARYNPFTDTWISMAAANAPSPRRSPLTVWTGTEMIVWGGFSVDSKGQSQYLFSGSRYNPTSNTWSALPTTNQPTGNRYAATAVWTGTDMIIWGGGTIGYKYNPITNTWKATSTASAPSARSQHTAVWTGTEMVIWGGRNASSTIIYNTGGRYNPTTDKWTVLPTANAPTASFDHFAVWTGSTMTVAGGQNSGNVGQVGKWDPMFGWTTSTTSNGSVNLIRSPACFIGSVVAISDKVYTFSLDALTGIYSSPVERFDHTAVWTGTDILVFGGMPSGYPLSSIGSKYTP